MILQPLQPWKWKGGEHGRCWAVGYRGRATTRISGECCKACSAESAYRSIEADGRWFRGDDAKVE